MWFFDKRISFADSGIFQGFIDWHCHLLPGVDDGVQTMDESLKILSLYEKMGIEEAWLTPHIMEDMPNATKKLKDGFAELKENYQGPVVLHLASENMLDNLFEERLEKDDLLPLGKEGKHLLVETSYFNPPMGVATYKLSPSLPQEYQNILPDADTLKQLL
jgi:tyrosine-protein phosphatase YwqE